MRKKKIERLVRDGSDFRGIFARLAASPELPQSKRIERLLDLVSRLREDMSKAERLEVLPAIRTALSRYRWTRQVSPTSEGFRVVTLPDRAADDKWELEAVQDVLSTIPLSGTRPRIRRCEECGEWLYAEKRIDQRFCLNGRCRQHNNDTDEEKRTRKLARMREQYAMLKGLARNRKSGVGLRNVRRPGRLVDRNDVPAPR